MHRTKNFLITLLLLILIPVTLLAQQNYTISGYINDSKSGETLLNATVRILNSSLATSTNAYGFYSISVPKGTHVLRSQLVGYSAFEQTLTVDKNITYNITMSTASQQLEEVTISSLSKSKNVDNPQMGVVNLNVSEIRKLPVVFGEKDILKTIQLLPGVASGGEGSANFYVRGGSGDQNLILLDEAIVYNASHLFGFFSTFNSDAIKDVNLYKGGIPAQYGGRASSVLDIAMLDGNAKKYAVEGGIGLIASRIKFDGPIVKDRGSFMISGRRTYADMFLLASKDETVKSSKLYFYDLNIKANYKFDDRNKLFLSGYFGQDVLGYGDLFRFDWGNATGTLRWNHIFTNKLFSNTSLIFSDFNYHVGINNDNSDFDISSRIQNINLKQDFQYYPSNRSTLKFGVHALDQTIKPASIDATDTSAVNSILIQKRRGLDLAAYISHEWSATDRLKLIYGLRMTNFMMLGPGSYYDFDAAGNPVQATDYKKGEIVQNYFNLEPRFSANYILRDNKSLKLSYNRNIQNLHQLTNSTSSLPTDQFVLSSRTIKPQIADQVALGYYQNFNNDRYEFSVESYYKNLSNQIDFKNGADLQANELLDGELVFGDGRAYGLEFFLKKRAGKLTGWLSYTLSKSERKFEAINNGAWFNARQDKTHNLSVVAMYQLSKTWTAGATFVYSTGDAVTLPAGKYAVDNRTVYYYTERNGSRMPNYHRLDLSMTYEPVANKDKRYYSSWSFGLYNAYARKNAYLIDFRDSETNPNITETYKVALFSLVPSVTWNFKF
ncbi:TonB-dependent receptor [Sphingobacteriaceae bacterium WQ 2009]|uniref:TonB-dependent receptor n=1 Tax=Rhinopithecimicrobium faecis TaxID=2820698 RepID=A0A8T4H929_9SPHI|nr:TonB-dependent receptor [Sphingobacteriaceae bacterium WQ 2009]